MAVAGPSPEVSDRPLPGMVPVRLRTPSGKTALFYASTAAGGLPAGLAAAAVATPPAQCAEIAEGGASGSNQAETVTTHQDSSSSSHCDGHRASMDGASQSVQAPEASFAAGQKQLSHTSAVSAGQFRVGDMVYRQGELALVVHVDQTLEPPAYTVRMARSGQDVSCERAHLAPAIGGQSVACQSVGGQPPQQPHPGLQAGCIGGHSPAFADIVHQQQQQQQWHRKC
mmetsp:Transcript_19127/g.49054  ORF Transcript_19127/g.49054 Transcript_19127/m.49054 type:complete len:227 (-) Transcript_19127:2-682(-)